MVQDQKPQPQQQENDPRKEGDVKVQMSVPVMHAGEALGFLGLGGGEQAGEEQPTTPMSPDEFLDQGGGGAAEHEELFADAHPDDVEELKQRMAESGRPMPQGASIPQSARQMPSRYMGGGAVRNPAQPAGQAGIPKFTGGGGGLPSQKEAFEYSMQDAPPIQTKQEFEAGQKAPSWWRMMLADFAGGAPGAGKEELDAKMDKAYQEAIQRQMQDRSEFERKQGVVGQYAISRGDEMVKFKFGNREIEVMRKNTGQLAAMFLEEYKFHTEQDKNVSLRTLLPDDPNAPDWHLPRDEALAYAKFFTDQTNAGLGTGRDLLRVKNPKLWQFLEDHDLAQAQKLAETKQTAADRVKQRQMSEVDQARERQAMEIEGEYGVEFSPQFVGYLDEVTRGQSSSYVDSKTGETIKTKGREAISDNDKAGYKENMMMMNHLMYKGKDGGESPYRDFWQRRLDKYGWYFMGEHIPDDPKKAKAKLRKMRDQNKADTVQTSAFMMAHFGDWNKKFEVDPANFLFLQPTDEAMQLGTGRYHYPEDTGVDPVTGKPLPGPDPLQEGEYPESKAREFMIENGLTWGETMEVLATRNKTVVMGR